jgi:hypothetical protein
MNTEDIDNKIEEFCGYITKTRLTRKDLLKTLAIFGGSLILLGQTESSYAHPPSDIIITFDAKTKILNAVIMHKVSNPENHFIKKIDTALNGQEIIEHKISRQDNNVSQTVSYLIPDAKTGDILSVEAYCSISGKLQKEIKLRF